MRKTTLTLGEICDQLANGSAHRACLLANELGEIAKSTKDPRAIDALCGLLESKDQGVQYAAYGWLSMYFADKANVRDAIDIFTSNPENIATANAFSRRQARATIA
jgi:hypothetical protein